MLEKLQSDANKEVKRREMAVKEKDQAVEKLQTYQAVYEELKISDPAKFSREFNEMQDELVKLNKNLAEKGKQIKSQRE